MALFSPAEARQARSKAVLAEYRRANACPSTGLKTGPCPGYVIDHLWPLCAGGADAVWNLAYQSIEASKRKDRWEKELCRAKRLKGHTTQ